MPFGNFETTLLTQKLTFTSNLMFRIVKFSFHKKNSNHDACGRRLNTVTIRLSINQILLVDFVIDSIGPQLEVKREDFLCKCTS